MEIKVNNNNETTTTKVIKNKKTTIKQEPKKHSAVFRSGPHTEPGYYESPTQ